MVRSPHPPPRHAHYLGQLPAVGVGGSDLNTTALARRLRDASILTRHPMSSTTNSKAALRPAAASNSTHLSKPVLDGFRMPAEWEAHERYGWPCTSVHIMTTRSCGLAVCCVFVCRTMCYSISGTLSPPFSSPSCLQQAVEALVPTNAHNQCLHQNVRGREPQNLDQSAK